MNQRYLSSILIVFAICVVNLGFSQGYEERLKAVDVQHYDFQISISDSSDKIEGLATIQLKLLEAAQSVRLDLVSVNAESKGMKVISVLKDGGALPFNHTAEELEIKFPNVIEPSTELSIQIKYEGIPADGLIISNSEKDGRSFFGDNWPNRAHNWLPVTDHPADKATVGFSISAPAHYLIVANGKMVEQKVFPNGRQLSRWDNPEPLPTKVMVFGAADFAMENVGNAGGVPVSTWVFRNDEKAGFHDYAQGKTILEWFVGHVGAYPWDKLANVQSRTRYGGMENASCIFYAETSVTGDASCEALMAHEIAHQWFGNSASEANWYHIWLSEGFATYWTNVYFEQQHGGEVFQKRMQEDRATIRSWDPTLTFAVVDPRIKDLNQLLNPNSYQKGGWVLHMLRHQIGDDLFFKGLREYYSRFKFGNALTSDLQKALEDVSGQNLQAFFQQWIFTPGHPKLDVIWSWSKGKKAIQLQILQLQKSDAFAFPLEMAFKDADGALIKEAKVEVNAKSQKCTIALDNAPASVELDPHTWLLFSGKARQK